VFLCLHLEESNLDNNMMKCLTAQGGCSRKCKRIAMRA
jgi:hypothetical protein